MINEAQDAEQRKAYLAWRANKYQGLVAGCTGFGKSRLGTWATKALTEFPDMELVIEKGEDAARRILLVVPTEPLRDDDWPLEFRRWGLFEVFKKHVTAICYASLPLYNLKDFALVIFDEGHHLTETMFESCQMAAAAQMGVRFLLLSATPPTKQEAEKMRIVQVLGGVVYTLPIDEGIKKGITSDYRIYAWVISMDDKEKWVEAGRRDNRFLTTEAKAYEFKADRLARLKTEVHPDYVDPRNGEPLDALELARKEQQLFMTQMEINRFIANLHCKRDVAKVMIKKFAEAGKRFIVFAGSIAMCDELCGEFAYHSKTVGRKRKNSRTALDRFRDGEINWMGAVDGINEGVNLPALDGAVMQQINSKKRIFSQRLGRSVRYRPDHTASIHVLLARDTLDEIWFQVATADLDQEKITFRNGDKLLAISK